MMGLSYRSQTDMPGEIFITGADGRRVVSTRQDPEVGLDWRLLELCRPWTEIIKLTFSTYEKRPTTLHFAESISMRTG
jgi:hypothetical protein